ncbi:MAG: hypothetical protein HYU66_06155 [Armatimonadetes bacterium]|nr:hypothetical protein [Armatimonadota bacterium]
MIEMDFSVHVDRTVLEVVDSFEEMNRRDREESWRATPAERFRWLEICRRANHGRAKYEEGFQRFLEVAER